MNIYKLIAVSALCAGILAPAPRLLAEKKVIKVSNDMLIESYFLSLSTLPKFESNDFKRRINEFQEEVREDILRSEYGKFLGLDKTQKYKEAMERCGTEASNAVCQDIAMHFTIMDMITQKVQERVDKLSDENVKTLLIQLKSEGFDPSEYLVLSAESIRNLVLVRLESEELAKFIDEAKKHFDIQFDPNTRDLAEKIQKKLSKIGEGGSEKS